MRGTSVQQHLLHCCLSYIIFSCCFWKLLYIYREEPYSLAQPKKVTWNRKDIVSFLLIPERTMFSFSDNVACHFNELEMSSWPFSLKSIHSLWINVYNIHPYYVFLLFKRIKHCTIITKIIPYWDIVYHEKTDFNSLVHILRTTQIHILLIQSRYTKW